MRTLESVPCVEEPVDDGLSRLDALGGEFFGVGERENRARKTRSRDVQLLGGGGKPVREERRIENRGVLDG